VIHRAGGAGGIEVAHFRKRFVRVRDIVVAGSAAHGAQVHGAQGDGLSQRIHSAARDIELGGRRVGAAGAAAAIRWNAQSLKQIIRRAILLENNDDMLDRCRGREAIAGGGRFRRCLRVGHTYREVGHTQNPAYRACDYSCSRIQGKTSRQSSTGNGPGVRRDAAGRG